MTSPSFPRPHVALVGGYTAGHVMPLIAVAEAYASLCPGAEFLAIGGSSGPERSLLQARALPFQPIEAAPFVGAASLREIFHASSTLYRSFARSRQVLKSSRAKLAIGFGGYVTAGPLLAARSLGLVTAIFEANVIPGRANRLLLRFADLVCVGQAETCSFPGWEHSIVVGHPIREEIRSLVRPSQQRGPVLKVLVTGGSLGSAFLDAHCPALLASLAKERRAVEILHQTCAERCPAVTEIYARLLLPARVHPVIDDMTDAYRFADVVVSAAGAGTLAELEALGLPALVVPMEASADAHQVANAEAFSRRTGNPHMRETAWEMSEASKALLSLADRRRARGSIRDATAIIVSHCEAALARSGRGRPATLVQRPSTL